MAVEISKSTHRISVALCTYNGAAYLLEQLETILNQTYPVAQIVAVDDGSDDRTIQILREFRERHPLLEVYHNEVRLGAIKNFEKALSLTRYDIIAIADQDDVWHPQKIEKMIGAWTPGSPLIYCNSVRFAGHPDFGVAANPRYARFYGSDGKKLMMFNTVSGHALMIRRHLLKLALPFEENVMYDWWLAMVAACNGGVTYLPELLVLQRAHGGNLTVNNGYSHRSAAGRAKYKTMWLPHLRKFASTPGMVNSDRNVAARLAHLMLASVTTPWSPTLFLFLFKHRHPFFYFQKKRFPLFSHLKYCWWFSTYREEK